VQEVNATQLPGWFVSRYIRRFFLPVKASQFFDFCSPVILSIPVIAIITGPLNRRIRRLALSLVARSNLAQPTAATAVTSLARGFGGLAVLSSALSHNGWSEFVISCFVFGPIFYKA
jgi:hypothetical protein